MKISGTRATELRAQLGAGVITPADFAALGYVTRLQSRDAVNDAATAWVWFNDPEANFGGGDFKVAVPRTPTFFPTLAMQSTPQPAISVVAGRAPGLVAGGAGGAVNFAPVAGGAAPVVPASRLFWFALAVITVLAVAFKILKR